MQPYFGVSQPDRLLIIGHYLVIDGFSWRILLNDLQDRYQQLSNGETIQGERKFISRDGLMERAEPVEKKFARGKR